MSPPGLDPQDGRGLAAQVRVVRGALDLDLRLDIARGRVLALLGPNGAGKTTTLEVLAGLVPLDGGHITVAGRAWDDPERRLMLRPEARSVAVVFQEYLLFPHLSVVENIAFGPRARGVASRVARRRAHGWLERMGLSDLAGEKPARLSGGQAQRVALARALATEPDLLLLDEPLAALDAATRAVVRSDLGTHLEAYPGCTVLVTHDAVDAMVLADELAVVEGGRAVQTGPPAQVARAPRTEYVARLVGLNLYRGRSDGRAVALDGGGVLAAVEPGKGEVLVAFPPATVALHRRRPEGSPRNVWEGRVVGMEQHADVVRVRLDARPPVLADVTTAAVADLGLTLGQHVWASVKATEIRAYPA